MTEQELARLRGIYADISAGRLSAALAKVGYIIRRVEAEHAANAAAYDALKQQGADECPFSHPLGG